MAESPNSYLRARLLIQIGEANPVEVAVLHAPLEVLSDESGTLVDIGGAIDEIVERIHDEFADEISERPGGER